VISEGKTLEQIQAAHLTRAWDARYGQKFITPEQVVGFVYQELTSKR